MGFRTEGPFIHRANQAEMVSSPVDHGIIQLLPDGNLVILTADHQTIGGYPRIASVIMADWPKLGQLCPGDVFSFHVVGLKEAEKLWMEQEHLLRSIQVIL